MSTSSEHGRELPSRWLALSGIGFVILVMLSFSSLGADAAGGNDPISEITSYYDAHQTREQASAFVLAAAIPLLVVFAVGLARATWPAEPRRRPFWQYVLIGGSVLAGAAFAANALLVFTLASIADNGDLAAGTIQTLNALNSNIWMMFGAGLGVLMLGAAGSLIPRAGAFRAFGWVALVAGIAFFIPYAAFVAMVATALWIIAMSIVLFRGQRESSFVLGAEPA